MITATIDAGEIRINLTNMLDNLTTADKMAIADRLSCEDDVIRFVAQQIIEGWTELSSQGETSWPTKSVPTTALDQATREVATRSGEAAKREIGRLEVALGYQEAKVKDLEAQVRDKDMLIRSLTDRRGDSSPF